MITFEEYNKVVLMKFEEKMRASFLPDGIKRWAYSNLQDALRDGMDFKELAERVRTLEKE